MVRSIEAAGVYTIAVTNTPAVFPQMKLLAHGTKYVRPALGLHPELAVQRASDLPLFRRYLPETRYVGEVGLDYVTTVDAERRTQRRIFDAILTDCRVARGKILTIHSRRAAADVVDAVGDAFPGAWILHWYSGSEADLRRAISNGAHLSINTAMAESDRTESLLRHVPRERILLESDGPFISVHGFPASPMSLERVVRRLAQWWGVGVDAAQSQLRSNARLLLQ
jgi:TatD DNase family protein